MSLLLAGTAWAKKDPHAQIYEPPSRIRAAVDAEGRTDDLYRASLIVGLRSYSGCMFTANCVSREMISGFGLGPAVDGRDHDRVGISGYYRYEFEVIGRIRWELGIWEMSNRSENYFSFGWEFVSIGFSYELRDETTSAFASLHTPIFVF